MRQWNARRMFSTKLVLCLIILGLLGTLLLPPAAWSQGARAECSASA